MIAQLDLFAAPPAPPPPVAVRRQAAPAPVAVSANNGTEEATPFIAAATDQAEPYVEPWEHIEADRQRLDGGDIDRSYSAQSLAEQGAVRSPFKFRGGDWINTGGFWHHEERECECYRIVPLEAFAGPSATYREWDWDAMRGNREIGSRHGMRAKHGSREVVLQGPPVVFFAGRPEQGALL